MIVSIAGNWEDAELEHKTYLSGVMTKYLLKSEQIVGPVTPVHSFINDVKKLVLSRDLDDILRSIEIFLEYKDGLGDVANIFVREIEKIFNYDRFTAKGKGWNAYALCKKSKSRICTYCNHAYAFTVQSENGDFRPTLDHFFLKDEYPHLALTLYNLIPSCSTCNSSLKGKEDFYKRSHLNPLFDENNIEFYFSYDGDPADLPDAIQAGHPSLAIKARAASVCRKSENSLATFVINERYDTLTVEALEFYRSKLSYDEAVVNDQLNLTFNESALLRFKREEFERYMLGKMYADIYDSLSR